MSQRESEAKRENVLAASVVRICKNCQDVMGIASMATAPGITTIEYHCKQCGAEETVKSAQS